MSVEFDFLGDKSLIDQMDLLAGKLGKKIYKKGMKAGTKFIWLKTRAKARAVLNKGYATGLVSNGITFKLKTSKKQGVYGLIMAPSRSALGISANDPYYYPAALEFGTRNMKPQPFIRSAFFESREKATKIASVIIKKEMVDELIKKKKKGAKKYRKPKVKMRINETLTNLHT